MRYTLFNPEDFLIFANDLLNNLDIGANESLSRSVISRSYYATFLIAREKIDNKDSTFIKYQDERGKPRGDIHRQVENWLRHFGSSFLRDRFYTLKRFRVDADYRFQNAENSENKNYYSDPNDINFARSCANMADLLIKRIKSL